MDFTGSKAPRRQRMTRTALCTVLIAGMAVFVGATVTTAPMSAITAVHSEESRRSGDARQNVHLHPSDRNAVIGEMRTMLHTISRVLHGMARGDLAMVESAARASGMAIAVNPDLQAKLPAHFVQQDLKVHRRFDELANAAKRNDNVLAKLAALTGYCISCHDTYRAVETR